MVYLIDLYDEDVSAAISPEEGELVGKAWRRALIETLRERSMGSFPAVPVAPVRRYLPFWQRRSRAELVELAERLSIAIRAEVTAEAAPNGTREEKIVFLYRAGWAMPRLAEEFGAGQAAIRAVLVKAGVEIRPQGGGVRDRDRIEAMASDRADGMTMAEIARKFGITRQAVSAQLKAHRSRT